MTTTTNQSGLNALKSDDLEQLASVTGDPCVSILMRTHRRGSDTRQGGIRLKNLLKEAGEKLAEAGHDEKVLEPLRSKPDEDDFWQHQGEGLAIYLTSDSCRLYRLNHAVDDIVVVNDAFFLQPLLCESNAAGTYFVLTLSWDEAQLFHAAGETLDLVETAVLPAKFDDLVLPRDPEEGIQNTSHRSVGNTSNSSVGMFHGQGEGEGKIEADRDQYLSLVGDDVADAIYNTGRPLVIVATKEVAGHFESTTNVRVTAKVVRSPSEVSVDELRNQTRTAVKPHLQADHEALTERYGTAKANDQGSSDLEQVLEAAESGRVELLMVCPVNQKTDNHPGNHDQANNAQVTDGRGKYAARIRINQAVVATLRTGGVVVQCRPESMPEGNASVAAIFRY